MLTKLVNGKREVMSPEEEAEIRAEWAENDRLAAIEAAKPPEPTLEDRLNALENENASLRAEVDDLTLRIPPR